MYFIKDSLYSCVEAKDTVVTSVSIHIYKIADIFHQYQRYTILFLNEQDGLIPVMLYRYTFLLRDIHYANYNLLMHILVYSVLYSISGDKGREGEKEGE